MKFLAFFGFFLLTILLIIALNRPWGLVPPVGQFLSPQHGFWQNAEAVDMNRNETFHLTGLTAPVDIYFDDRLVPHVFAATDEDAFFAEGYLHAKFRLWQMEFQTFAAAGRISELIGSKAIGYDREKRRLGMVPAAQNLVATVERDPVMKTNLDAYTAGVNAWIGQLKASQLPIEYKLLNYRPEKWTNLKSALFIKFMALDLAGGEDDFEYSNLRDALGYKAFDKLFPVTQDSLDPIVPRDTTNPVVATLPVAPAASDSLYLKAKDSVHNVTVQKPDKDNGSNNWAVAGKKTKSGAPILCNDPHLGLNLPSLWFEIQLTTASMKTYGASLPGAPGIVIGFNDSIAFGLTNAERDVRDYYEISFRDDTRKEYRYNGDWKTTEFRYDTVAVKDSTAFIDTVALTVFGPVMYDKSFAGNDRTAGDRYYAVRWKGADTSDELKVFVGLDRAKNYNEYLEAIKFMGTPGQNFAFASKNGEIALWDQGEFPAKWKRQGDFIMPGQDSTYMWQGMIPQDLNPHQVNPERGFVSSANQLPEDPATYPFYLGGSYPLYRGIMINRVLGQMNAVTIEDMMRLQTDTYNVFAEMARPLILHFLDSGSLNTAEQKFYRDLVRWDLQEEPDSRGASVFVTFWDTLTSVVYSDEYAKIKGTKVYPPMSTLLETLLRDSTYEFLDDVTTSPKEGLRTDMMTAFHKMAEVCRKADENGELAWGRYKMTHIGHLAHIGPFSREKVFVGGGNNCISAMKQDHGPSWRMIVQLSTPTEAYGVYPGGQSGNPGSPYYENFIDSWAANKYYPLWVMSRDQTNDKRIIGKMSLQN